MMENMMDCISLQSRYPVNTVVYLFVDLKYSFENLDPLTRLAIASMFVSMFSGLVFRALFDSICFIFYKNHPERRIVPALRKKLSNIFLHRRYTAFIPDIFAVIIIILHLDKIAKSIVFRCSYTERLRLFLFSNSNSRSINDHRYGYSIRKISVSGI